MNVRDTHEAVTLVLGLTSQEVRDLAAGTMPEAVMAALAEESREALHWMDAPLTPYHTTRKRQRTTDTE